MPARLRPGRLAPTRTHCPCPADSMRTAPEAGRSRMNSQAGSREGEALILLGTALLVLPRSRSLNVGRRQARQFAPQLLAELMHVLGRELRVRLGGLHQ